MQSNTHKRVEQNPMTIIGDILAEGAIRHLDRQKKERRAAQQSNETMASRLRTNPWQHPASAGNPPAQLVSSAWSVEWLFFVLAVGPYFVLTKIQTKDD